MAAKRLQLPPAEQNPADLSRIAKEGGILIEVIDGESKTPHEVLVRSFDELKELLEQTKKVTDYDIRIEEGDNCYIATFWRHNIKKNYSIVIHS